MHSTLQTPSARSRPAHLALMLRIFPVLLAAGLMGCAGTKGEMPVAFDLGSLTPMAGSTGNADARPLRLPVQVAPLMVADVIAAPWLDTQMMYFRLSYESDQQPRPYANSRWSMTPPQLLGQRVKVRLAQAGATVVSAADGALGLPVLRIEADDFSQRFSSAGRSDVHVAWRASVFNGHVLVAQKHFEQARAAPSADAAGGARALADSTDSLIADMTLWLAALPLKR